MFSTRARITSYSIEKALAVIEYDGYLLRVDTTLLGPFNPAIGALYQFIGELEEPTVSPFLLLLQMAASLTCWRGGIPHPPCFPWLTETPSGRVEGRGAGFEAQGGETD